MDCRTEIAQICIYHEMFFFLLQLWLEVLLGVVVWAGLWSLRNCETFVQVLLACRVSTKKPGVIVTGWPFCDLGFPLAGSTLLPLFCTVSVLIITCCSEFLFWPCVFGVCSILYLDRHLFRPGECSSMTSFLCLWPRLGQRSLFFFIVLALS